MLKKSSLLLILMAFNLNVFANELLDNQIAASRKVAFDFTQGLGKVLKSQLESSGAEGAVSVCIFDTKETAAPFIITILHP
jgi:hypothetical protein